MASFELFKSPNVDSYIGLARGNSELCLKKILGGNDEGIESLIKAWERSLRGGFLEVEKHFFQEHGSILELCAENNSPMANDVCAAIKEIEAHFSKIRNDVSAALSADVSSSLKDLQKKGDYSKLSSLIDLERRLKIELNRCYREALEK
ncbi:MAG: hypothetical protein LBI95_04265, partial [Holosporales bacterium]|nr:hypothetical protein [Holosporales bacterium]